MGVLNKKKRACYNSTLFSSDKRKTLFHVDVPSAIRSVGDAGIQRVTNLVGFCHKVGTHNGLGILIGATRTITFVVCGLSVNYVLHWKQSPLCDF